MKKPTYTIVAGTECSSVMLPSGKVGEIYGTTLVTKRDPIKHVMRKWNAYGINTEIIDSGLFDTVVFEEPSKNLMITVDDLKTYSRIEHVEDEDTQYFVPLDKLLKL